MDLIQKLLLSEISEKRTPSLQYALFNVNSVLKRYAFGFADIVENKSVNAYTTYNAFSVTKTFTALAILQLEQAGKLLLSDPIKKYLPDIPYNSKIKIENVLCHSSGIPNPVPLSWIHLISPDNNFNRDHFFKEIITKNPDTRSAPNEKYAYSNLGYVLLGQIIERVSGIKYEEYIKSNIINTLGAAPGELGFEITALDNHANGYHKRLSFSYILLGFMINKPEFMDRNEPNSEWRSFKPFYVNGASYGGLIGTPDSFIKYIQLLLSENCKFINDHYRDLLFTENYTTKNKPTGMCFSWFKGTLNGYTYFAHAGGGGGYYCEIRIYRELGLGSVIFFNRTGMSDERFLDKTDTIYFENGG